MVVVCLLITPRRDLNQRTHTHTTPNEERQTR
jgi:hypothetical protein